MTGFARAEGAVGDFGWTWELKSVNGRNLDLRCRFPAGYEHLDGFVRARAAESLKRGNVAVTLTVDDAASQGRLAVNRAALDQILAIVDATSAKEAIAPLLLDAGGYWRDHHDLCAALGTVGISGRSGSLLSTCSRRSTHRCPNPLRLAISRS